MNSVSSPLSFEPKNHLSCLYVLDKLTEIKRIKLVTCESNEIHSECKKHKQINHYRMRRSVNENKYAINKNTLLRIIVIVG